MLRTSELQSKEVININTGQRLGMIVDVDIDLSGGKIEGIVVPRENGFFDLFGGENDLYIPWDKIHKIGEDVILIKASRSEVGEERIPEE